MMSHGCWLLSSATTFDDFNSQMFHNDMIWYQEHSASWCLSNPLPPAPPPTKWNDDLIVFPLDSFGKILAYFFHCYILKLLVLKLAASKNVLVGFCSYICIQFKVECLICSFNAPYILL